MKFDDSIQITGLSGQLFAFQDHEGVGNICAGMRADLLHLVFVLSLGSLSAANQCPISKVASNICPTTLRPSSCVD
jgi:hypothetical protein